MNDEEIKKLVEKEVADAKLDVAEKRFRNLVMIAGAFLTIFGVVLPLYITSSSSNKVDDAIKEMKNDVNYITETSEKRIDKLEVKMKDEIKYLKGEVKELSNEQKNNLVNSEKKLDNKISEYEDKFNSITKEAFRRPKLVSTVDGQDISGKVFNLDKYNRDLILKVENEPGGASAKNIKIFVFLKSEDDLSIFNDFRDQYETTEDGYRKGEYRSNPFSLDPEQYEFIRLGIHFQNEKVKKGNVQVKLILYYEQPERTEYNFTLNVDYN